MSKKDEPTQAADVVRLGNQLPNGQVPYERVQLVEHEDQVTPVVSVGLAHFVEPGAPVPEEAEGGEYLQLRRIEGNNYEVTGSSSAGPAKVNSKAYRDGWDSIFGRQAVGQA